MLVVDDIPENLELIRHALSNENVQLFTAPTAEVALERFMQVWPRLVLSDLVLPGMDGLGLLDQVMAKDPGTDFVLMTGHYSTDSAVDAIRRGAGDYLPKPLGTAKLRACIRNLVEEAGVRKKALDLDHELVDAYKFEGM